MKNFVRSKKHGCFKFQSSTAWGKFLQPAEDPEGVALTKFERTGIQLIKDFPKVPPELWSRIIGLYFYMCPPAETLSASYHDSQLEVQVCFLRDVETKQKWKVVVPKQTVSGISVKSELNQCIDIATGEKYDQFPPPGWLHAGSSHSHNTMDAFFSSIDDKSELTVPGLHIVVGNIDHDKLEYSYQASVVLRKMRKDIELEQAVAVNSGLELEFHEDVLDYINTVITANTELYSKLGKLTDEPEDSSNNDTSFSEILSEIEDNFLYDMELITLVEDRFRQGASLADINKNIEAAYKAANSDERQPYNEHCGECGLRVEHDWDECPNCATVFGGEKNEI